MRVVETPRFLSDLQAAVDTIVIGQWDGDKAWDYVVEANKDGSVSVRATANQTIFMDTVYHSVVYGQDQDGHLALIGDPSASIRAEFDEFHVVGTFQQIGEEIERNYLAVHKALAAVADRHGIQICDELPRVHGNGVRVAEEAMISKFSDEVLLAEVNRRGLSSSQ